MIRVIAAILAVVVMPSGPAGGQTVLERVLKSLDEANGAVEITGVVGNTATNIGPAGLRVSGDVPVRLAAGDVISLRDSVTGEDVIAEVQADGSVVGLADGRPLAEVGVTVGAQVYQTEDGTRTVGPSALTETGGSRYTPLPSAEAVFAGVSGGGYAVDGSISNIVSGPAGGLVPGRSAGATAHFGNMTTSVLGAVNTGEISMGAPGMVGGAAANAVVRAGAAVTPVTVGAADGLVVLNSALNSTNLDGSITNILSGADGGLAGLPSVSPEAVRDLDALPVEERDMLTGTMSTNVIGAVNSGTIRLNVESVTGGQAGGAATEPNGDVFAAPPVESIAGGAAETVADRVEGTGTQR